jgi:integrase
LAGFRLTGIPLSANLLEHLQTYLRKGRPALLTDPCETALFLSRTGLRMESYRIRAIAGCRGGPLVTASLLRRSWLAHREASSGRRLTEF